MRIVVLGAGVMGTAFTFPVSDNGHDVALVGTHLDAEIIAALKSGGPHPRLGLVPGRRVVPLAHTELARAIEGADLVVLGVSSAGIPWAAATLAPVLQPGVPVLSLTKGMAAAADGLRILPDAFADLVAAAGGRKPVVCAIGGPCIAAELAVRRQTAVALGGRDRAMLARIAPALTTDYYHVHTSEDLEGVEVCAAFKNLFAIGVGAAAGLREKTPPAANGAGMHNPAAALFAQAVAEIAHIVERMGGRAESAWGLPGTGDLYVTVLSGRNSRLGRWLGLGLTYGEAKARHMAADTVEGAELALAAGPALRSMMARGALDPGRLPLLQAILAAVCDGAPLVLPWPALGGVRPTSS
jgi:glycerol-3-phosphate dehydrogenase (NAD(P)+)